MEPPEFLPNDVVFAIPEWQDSFGLTGFYKISKVTLIPEFVGSETLRYEYYAIAALAQYVEVKLKHVFKDKDEFLEFVKRQKFSYRSPEPEK